MKTLTEFSGTIIRIAAKAEAEAKSTQPKIDVPAEGTPDEATVAALQAAAAKVDEAIAKETNLSGDRLARLKEAIQAVGDKTADVRLVRVFTGDSTPANGKKIGEHVYVVDIMPASLKPQFARPEKERGGRGGGGRGGGGGGGRESGGPPTGGFSMDSLKDDRKSRGPGGGRGPGGPGGGGGRGPGGGGRGPGGPKA